MSWRKLFFEIKYDILGSFAPGILPRSIFWSRKILTRERNFSVCKDVFPDYRGGKALIFKTWPL
jgi:hypothetical protein